MYKAKDHGMKGLSLKVVGIFGRAIGLISQKGMSKAAHVNADLVGSSRFQPTFNVGGISEAFQNPIMGDRFFSVFVVNGHFFSVNRVAANGSVNGSLVFFEVSCHNGAVPASDGVFLQLFSQIPVRLVIFAD